MSGMQLSLFADADLTVAVPPTPRARRATRSAGTARTTRTPRTALASRIAATHAARDADSHAVAVDAVLIAATPRVRRIAQLFIPSWPAAHVDLDDLTQEGLLEVAASLHLAPCTNEGQTQAWLSSLVMEVLHSHWRAAVQDAADLREALMAFGADLEHYVPDHHSDDDHVCANEPYHSRAA